MFNNSSHLLNIENNAEHSVLFIFTTYFYVFCLCLICLFMLAIKNNPWITFKYPFEYLDYSNGVFLMRCHTFVFYHIIRLFFKGRECEEKSLCFLY